MKYVKNPEIPTPSTLLSSEETNQPSKETRQRNWPLKKEWLHMSGLRKSARRLLQEIQQHPRTTNLVDRVVHTRQLIQAEKTPYEVIYDNGLSRIRYYPTPPEYKAVPKKNVPLVIVAPLGVNMLVYDLFPHRSFVHYMLSQGFEVYLLDWGNPGRSHTDRNFASYIVDDMPRLLAKIRDHSHKSYLTLHGWSMGGLFTLLYTAYFKDELVKNLIILGSPVDSYKAGILGTNARIMGSLLKLAEEKTRFHPRVLPRRLWHTYGWMNQLGFKLIDPVSTLRSFINFVRELASREKVQAHATLGAILNDMVDYPGGIVYDVVNHIWLENSLFRGEYPLRGHKVDIASIQQSILAVAGADDAIVHVDAVSPIRDKTGSSDVEVMTIPGGHLGIVSNQEAHDILWPYMSKWLGERDSLPEIGYSGHNYPLAATDADEEKTDAPEAFAR